MALRTDQDGLGGIIRAMTRHRSMLVLMLCGLALSIYSGFTTLQGMQNFTSDGTQLSVMALLATIGIQGVMLVSAWIIGDRVKFWGTPSAWFTNVGFIAMFLATMACSVFFSYDSIFSSAADERYRTRFSEIAAHETVTKILRDLPDRIDAHVAASRAETRNGDAWRDYENRMRRLIALEANHADAITALRAVEREAATTARAVAQDRTDTAERSATRLRSDLAATKSEIDALGREIADLRARLPTLARKYETTDAAYRAAEADVLREALGVEGAGLTGKRGCGPACRAKRARAKTLQADSLHALTARDAATKRLRATERLRARKQAEATGLSRRLARAEQGLAPSTGSGSAGALDATSDLPTLRVALNAFGRAPSTENLTTAVLACTDLQTRLARLPRLQATPPSCEPRGLDDQLAALTRLDTNRANFKAACTDQQGRVPTLGFDQALAFGGSCLRQTGLPFSAVADEQRALNTLARESTAAAHNFYQSWKALGVLDTLAIFAFAVAIGIDMLTFFTGILGAQTTFSPMDRVRLPDVRVMLMNVSLDDKSRMLQVVKPERPRESGGFSSVRADAYVGAVQERDLDKPGVRRIIQIAMGRNARGDEPLIRQQAGKYYIHGILRDELEFQLGEAGGVARSELITPPDDTDAPQPGSKTDQRETRTARIADDRVIH